MKKVLTAFVLIMIGMPAMAFDCQTIDQQLAQALEISNKYGSYGDERDERKTDIANEQIAKIVATTAHDGNSMSCSFNHSQKNGLRIVTSTDKKFRAFSWDSNIGGTMHEFSNSIQYIDNKGISYAKPIDKIEFVTSLFTTTIQDKPLYLLVTTGTYSTADTSQILNLYQIDGDKLIEPKLIKTNEGLTNTLGFEFNFFSVVERPERPIKLFEFDGKSKTIRFPVVLEDKEFMYGKVTNRKISYQFDGNYFVKK